MFKTFIFFALFTIACLLALWLTPLILTPPSNPWLLLTLIRCCILLLGMVMLIAGLYRVVKTNIPETFKNIAVLFSTFMLLTLVFETGFMWYPFTCSDDTVLTHKTWTRSHWRENELGYRDVPVFSPVLNNTCNIAVLGDSFTAGAGIKDTANRFSNLLQKKLPRSYRVFNMGVCGADTQNEYNFLTVFPQKINLLILVHYENDIEYQNLCNANTKKWKNNRKKLSFLPLFIEKNSFFLNFLTYAVNQFAANLFTYYQLNIKKVALEDVLKHQTQNAATAANYLYPDILNEHLANINHIANYCRNHNIELIMVLFPRLSDSGIEFTEKYANRPIYDFFSAQGITVIDLYQTVKQLPERKRIVNRFDKHPSVLLNHITADTIYTNLNRLDLLNNLCK